MEIECPPESMREIFVFVFLYLFFKQRANKLRKNVFR